MKTAVQELARLFTRWSRDPDQKIAVVRLLVLFALLPLMWWDIVSPDTQQVLIGLTALIGAYILTALFVLPRLHHRVRDDLLLTIDILSIAALVWFTGGIRSSLLFLFYLPILAAAIRLDLRQAILSALAVSGIVVWMWNVSEGRLPSLESVNLRVGLFAGSSLGLAIIFGFMAQESRTLRDRATRNRDLNNQLTTATEQLQRRLGELEFAYEFSRRLAAVTDTAAVLVTVTKAAQQLLRAPHGAVFLANASDGELDSAYTGGLAERDTLPVMRACASEVRRTADPFTVEVDGLAVLARALCAPIVVGDRLLGVLCAGGDNEWHPARHAVAVLGHVASQAGIALDRVSLLEDLKRVSAAKPDARLFTRDQLDQILRDELARATQLGMPCTLLKLILTVSEDDTPEGPTPPSDRVHRRAAELVQTIVRRADVVAQGTPGELFVLLSMTNLTGAKKFVTRLLRELKTDPTLAKLLGRSKPDVRVGIALFPEDGVSAAELIYAAQNAVESADPDKPVISAHDLHPHHSRV
jgi:GGDEF domain-containing protein